MNSLPKINQLRNLRTVIFTGSIRAAATATNQTSSAVTRSIQELENIIGAPLLKRGTHGIQLTEMGAFFEPYMHKVLNELERGMGDLSQFISESQAEIRFGCSHLPAYGIMPSIIKDFQKRYPQSKLTVIEGQFSELVQSLRSGKLSFFVGITMADISLDHFHVEYLSSAQFYVFSSKDHPLVKSSSLEDLRNAKWYLPGAGAEMFHSLEKIIFPYGVGPEHSILYGDSVAIAEQLILNEDYISIGPKEILDNNSIRGMLSVIDVCEPLPIGRYAIIMRMKMKQPPMTKWLIDEVRHKFKT
ncbi:LysR substrate-binding domain-containing protein [Yersinia enterocolitica]|uniref:LysR substrate-binding domain-containing protein n=1 Tax=Yersinia enterocolitica TaxID=630 RepID=UPI002AC4CD62|nr:LysR family transcriptional regulator [Yersinia enterocolitica]